MKLDKSKKYEFCGEVYEQGSRDWYCGDRSWEPSEFQFFADYGHVKEIREPLVFEGEVTCHKSSGREGVGAVTYHRLPSKECEGKTFKVTWTEVVK